jgi:hypothetical protein
MNGDRPVHLANITLRKITDSSIVVFTFSATDGRFGLKLENVAPGAYWLMAEHIEAEPFSVRISVPQGNDSSDSIVMILKPRITSLQEIRIKADPQSPRIRKDTIEFRAGSFLSPETRKVEDLLRNMQGFSINADGRISFNGKEVEKILVEGEDMTGKNYPLISKNLNAGLVDKVQVIPNYHDDRIAGEIEQSGKIGINLTIDNKAKNRVSGGVEAGIATDGRTLFDQNLIYFSGRWKMLSFLNFNEIGQAADANLWYYFNEDNSPGSSAGDDGYAVGLVQTGQVSVPPLGETYTRDNKDLAATSIVSYRAGEHTRVKAMVSGVRGSVSQRADNLVSTFTPLGETWVTSGLESAAHRVSRGIAALSVHHDARRNNNGFYQFEFLKSQLNKGYSQITAISLLDTLEEELLEGQQLFRLRGYESFRLPAKKMFKINFRLSFTQDTTFFLSRTERYAAYFRLDSTYNRYAQQTRGRESTFDMDLTLSGKMAKVRYVSGVGISGLSNRYTNQSLTRAENGHWVSVSDHMAAVVNAGINLFGVYSLQTGTKGFLQAAGKLGAGNMTVRQGDSQRFKSLLSYRVTGDYSLRFSPLKNMGLQYSFDLALPGEENFFPYELLTGQASLQHPAALILPVNRHKWKMHYSSRNFHTSTGLLVSMSYQYSPTAYATGFSQDIYMTVYCREPVRGNSLLTLLFNLEKFVHPVRNKIVFQLTESRIRNAYTINQAPGRTDLNQLSFQLKVISAYMFPLNTEFTFSPGWIRQETTAGGTGALESSFWQYSGYGKIRLILKRGLQASLVYNYYRLSPASFFHTMDGYLFLRSGKKVTVSTQLHNLFGAGQINQRTLQYNQVAERRFDLVDRYILVKLAWQF